MEKRGVISNGLIVALVWFILYLIINKFYEGFYDYYTALIGAVILFFIYYFLVVILKRRRGEAKAVKIRRVRVKKRRVIRKRRR